MKIKNVLTALLVMLFLTGITFGANAQEWRWREKYYSKHHTADDEWYKDHSYYSAWGGGIFNWGRGLGMRDFYYNDYSYDDSLYHEYQDKYYNDFSRDYKSHRPCSSRCYDEGNCKEHYYHNYRDRVYDDYYHGYHDNYRPEVDNNK
jgi:hypothetical protein